MSGRHIGFGAYIDNRLAVALDDYPLGKLLDAAVMCEELGYGSLWVGDSWLAKPRFEPITTLAAVAMKTQRVRLGTSILQPHLRNPIQLALTWATLDVLASGRTILGVGLGAGRPTIVQKEYELFGIDARRRGRVFEECIEVLKRLWAEDEVSYSGTHSQFANVSLAYKPAQRPHPPIWIAAGVYLAERHFVSHLPSKKAQTYHLSSELLERVARLGDGWWTTLPTPREYEDAFKRIGELARSFGRSAEAVHPALCTWININPNGEKARDEGRAVLERYHGMPMDRGTVDRCCFGTPSFCLNWIERYIEAGVKTFGLVFRSFDLVRQMKSFAKEVLPSF